MENQSASLELAAAPVGLDELLLDVFAHLVIEPKLPVLVLEVGDAAVSADVPVDTGRHVRLNEVVTGCNVECGQEPTVLLQKVLLVIVLGIIELLVRNNLGNDLSAPLFLSIHHRLLGQLLLFFVVVEYY